MNISEAVKKVLARYPYLDEYMGLGIINYRALARKIQADVGRELGAQANIQSVVSAVRRYPVSMGKGEREKVFKILSMSEVGLRYDVGVVTISSGAAAGGALHEIDASLITIQGVDMVTVVIEERLVGDFKKRFEGSLINSNVGLASVIVKSPEEIASTSGVIAHLANIFALEKINVVEMMSSYTETWFIVSEKDALKAVEAIRREIKRARGS